MTHWFSPALRKDPTGAERQRRYRERKATAEVAADPGTVAVDTLEMIGLAGRLTQGIADRQDCSIAAALIMTFVRQVRPTGSVNISADP